MARLKQIEDMAKELSPEEIAQLRKDLKSIEEEIRDREAEVRAQEYKKKLTIDDTIRYRKGGSEFNGRVVGIRNDSVKVIVDGGQRARNVKWSQIVEVKK